MVLTGAHESWGTQAQSMGVPWRQELRDLGASSQAPPLWLDMSLFLAGPECPPTHCPSCIPCVHVRVRVRTCGQQPVPHRPWTGTSAATVLAPLQPLTWPFLRRRPQGPTPLTSSSHICCSADEAVWMRMCFTAATCRHTCETPPTPLPGTQRTAHRGADGAPAAPGGQSGDRCHGGGGPWLCLPADSVVVAWGGAAHCWGCSAARGSGYRAVC